MSRWDVLKAVANLIHKSGFPDQPPNRFGLAWHIGRGSLALVFRDRNVAVLPHKLDVGADGIVFTECATLRDVLVRSVRKRSPAFVLPGSLALLCEYFGIDHDDALIIRSGASRLAICFGHLHGREVVVHASMGGAENWITRQVRGATIGREVLGILSPLIIDATQVRMIAARLPGHSYTPWKLTESELQAAIVAALEPLKQIFGSGHWDGQPDDDLIEVLQSYVMQSSRQAELQSATDLLQHWDRTHLKTVCVHGDYWLDNILFSEGCVTGVVDWDHARANGCAGIDALHLGFMSYAMWSGVHVSELLADIYTQHWHFPWLSSYCALISEQFSVSPGDLKYLAILLWLSYFLSYEELHPEVYATRDSGVADWYAQMTFPMRSAIRGVQWASRCVA